MRSAARPGGLDAQVRVSATDGDTEVEIEIEAVDVETDRGREARVWLMGRS